VNKLINEIDMAKTQIQTYAPLVKNRGVVVGCFLLCFLFFSSSIECQQVIVGRIIDSSDGQPVVGANIYIANTTIGTSSDASGDYKLTVPGFGSIEIIVSSIGFDPFLYKIDSPKPLHQLNVSLKIFELPEVVVTPRKTYRSRDVDLFWRTILGVRPTRKGLQVLNPEKVYLHLNNENVLKVFCNEPIEVVNHELGYHIRYVLKNFEHDYKTGESKIAGMPFFEELNPKNSSMQRRWEKKRQEVYSVSITRFIRALYHQNIHEEGFLLVKLDTLTKSTTKTELKSGMISTISIDSTKQTTYIIPLTDILQKDQMLIDSLTLYLACFSKPVTEEMIENSYFSMFESDESFPVAMLPPQQFTVYPDGTYSGTLRLNMFRNQIIGLSATTPLEYGLNRQETNTEKTIVSQELCSLKSIQDNINSQLSLFPQEKLHLHIDRTMYVPGERIWFKAYLTDGFSHQPRTNSRYVYVELISPVDSLVQRVMLRRGEDNMYYGHLFLSEKIPAGFYTIRAYTRFMENLGEDCFFKKNIQIGNLSKETGNERNSRENIDDRSIRDDYDVAFMPEGGNLIDGQFCKIAFKAQNRDGTSDYITGELIDETEKHICKVQTFYSGMGYFDYVPERGKKYFLKSTNLYGTEKTFELPMPQNTFSVCATWRRHDNIHLVTLNSSEDIPEKPLYLLAHSGGAVLYFSKWDHQRNLLVFSGDELPSGIIQIILFDEAMNPLSERLIFNKNMQYDKAEVVFSTDKPVYEKRDKVIVAINIPQPASSALGRIGERPGNLSVSITDDRDLEADTLTTILSSLLLSSELKGYIETPAYYLQDNPYSEMALDLLMMTHGWRRYNIPEVVKGVYETTKIDFEVSKEITGNVKSIYSGKPLAGSEVTIVSNSGEFDIAVTDSLGRFGVYGLEYPDSARFMVTAFNQKGSENVVLSMNEERFPKLIHVPDSPLLALFENNFRENIAYNDSITLTAISRVSLTMKGVKMEGKKNEFIAKASQRALYDEDIRMINLNEIVVTARRIEKKDEARLKDWRNRSSDVTIDREWIENKNPVVIDDILHTIPGVEVITYPLTGEKIVIIRKEIPLVLVDGFPVDNFYLTTLDIQEIESIDVFKTLASAAVFGLQGGGSSVISITTRRGSSGAEPVDFQRYNYTSFTPLGYQTSVEFYSPKYETPESKQSGNPDYRATIFWKPDIVVSDAGTASFEFYTSDFPTTYSVVIEGISSDGKIIRHVDKIEVK